MLLTNVYPTSYRFPSFVPYSASKSANPTTKKHSNVVMGTVVRSGSMMGIIVRSGSMMGIIVRSDFIATINHVVIINHIVIVKYTVAIVKYTVAIVKCNITTTISILTNAQ